MGDCDIRPGVGLPPGVAAGVGLTAGQLGILQQVSSGSWTIVQVLGILAYLGHLTPT